MKRIHYLIEKATIDGGQSFELVFLLVGYLAPVPPARRSEECGQVR